MATAHDKNLINQVRKSAALLRIAGSWVNSGLPLNLEDDFVFELYVLFRLIIDLGNTYEVKYDPGIGNKMNKFPQKPANKQGRPKFEVYRKSDGVLLWQICTGTKIADIHGKKRAPDISFQSAQASDTPSYSQIELIWDAKYRKNSGDAITDHEFSSFARWLEVMKLRNKTKPAINLNALSNLVGNCLLTNGAQCTEPDVECQRADLKEVTSFYPGKMFSVRP